MFIRLLFTRHTNRKSGTFLFENPTFDTNIVFSSNHSQTVFNQKKILFACTNSVQMNSFSKFTKAVSYLFIYFLCTFFQHQFVPFEIFVNTFCSFSKFLTGSTQTTRNSNVLIFYLALCYVVIFISLARQIGNQTVLHFGARYY